MSGLEIKTEYFCNGVIKEEPEMNNATHEIKLEVQHNIKKEEKSFKYVTNLTSETASSSCNDYTSQLQTVVEQFENSQPDVSNKIKPEVPFYFTDSIRQV